jgi:hypothetical protein
MDGEYLIKSSTPEWVEQGALNFSNELIVIEIYISIDNKE